MMISDSLRGGNNISVTLAPSYSNSDVVEAEVLPGLFKNVTQGNQPDPFYFYRTPQLILLCVLFVLIVAGNSAVLVALLKSKGRKSRMNFFIMHLAFADLLVGLVNVLIDIIWRITIAWDAGNFACKFIRYLQVLVTYSSTYVLVALSIDRYDAITRPMKFSGSWRRAKLLVITAWTLSAVFSLPIAYLYRTKAINGVNQCWLEFGEQWQWRVYMTSIALAVFIIPAVIIIICYAIIVRTIWSKGNILVLDAGKSGSRTKRVKSQEDADCRRVSSRGLIPRAKVKTVKMTFVIVIVFILCWSPYFVFDLLQVYDYIPVTQTTFAIATFVQSLAPLNSAANPLIYCLFSTRICSTLRKIVPFKWVVSGLSACFPDLGEDSAASTRRPRHRRRSGCLRYGTDMTSSTATAETFTHSSRRSRLLSGTSLRFQQIVVYSGINGRRRKRSRNAAVSTV